MVYGVSVKYEIVSRTGETLIREIDLPEKWVNDLNEEHSDGYFLAGLLDAISEKIPLYMYKLVKAIPTN